MNPAIEKILTELKAVVSSTLIRATNVQKGLIPKFEVYVQVHLQALAIGASGGLLIGGLLGHFL